MDIGVVIKKYRKEAGMTQEEMANRLGVTTPAVNKWENSNSKPDIELLAPIARLLDISLDTLLSFHENLSDTEIEEIIRKMDRMFSEEGYEKTYEKYENVIFSGFSTLNFVLSTMAGLALRENDIGYARFLSGKVQAVAHTLEMGKYNEYSPMLDIVCAGKDVEGTYKVIKHLLDNVGTMYDFRKSGLYKHMKFRDIDEAILDSVKEKLLEGFRNEEEFGYMTGYEPWEKLIFDR